MAVPEHVRAPRVVAPVTPNVVEHDALDIVVLPVTPRVPEHAAFAIVVAPVTPKVVPIVQPFVTTREFSVAAPDVEIVVAVASPRFPRVRL